MSELAFMLLAFTVFFAVVLAVYNNIAIVKKYRIQNDKLAEKLRIVLISDFHNKKYNRGNTYITGKISRLEPDLIVISGDFVDRRRPDYDTALRLLNDLRAIADVYFISGNHEIILGKDAVIDALSAETVLLDDRYRIYNNFSILGLSDSMEKNDSRRDILSVFEKLDNFKIAVVHCPSQFVEDLCLRDCDIDLVLCGHTHGGLIRIPFFGALVCPNEGFLPKYSKGMYNENGTVMIVSGGLGNSLLPLRINNFPEIVVIDAEK